MPTTHAPGLSRSARQSFEVEILNALAESPSGATLGDLRARFEGQPITRALDHLEERGQVDRFPGLVFHITALGRSRLAP